MATDDELDDARVLASIGRIIGTGNLLPLVDGATYLPPAPTTDAIRDGLAELDEDGRIADAAVPERLDEATLNGTFVGPIEAANDTGMGVRRKTSATHGTGYVFGTAASFGFAGTGSPAEIAGAFGIYQEYGKASKGSNILKTTQGGYAITNYWGPTVDDSAEGFSSAVILKAGPSGFTQAKQLTAFEAIAQVETTNTLDDSAGAYALGVGSRINVLGTGLIKQGYGFKASVNTSGGPPYGTIDKYTAFAQITGSGATLAYGLYVVDAAISETSIGVGASGWTGQASLKRAGNSDSAVSLMVLKGPDTSPGLTELSLVAGTSQTRSIMEARDSGGTARFQITSAGAVNMRGQQISVNDSSGVVQVLLAPGTGITFTDARDIVVGSTTGTKIGTGTGQKLGFWGKTPVARQTLPGAGVVTADDIRTLLIAIGVAA